MKTNSRILAGLAASFLLAHPAGAYTVLLAWYPNPVEENVINYKIYRGTNSGNYSWSTNTGNMTNCPVYLPDATKVTYYFVLTAQNNAGLESDPNIEISFTIPSDIPRDPWNIRARGANSCIPNKKDNNFAYWAHPHENSNLQVLGRRESWLENKIKDCQTNDKIIKFTKVDKKTWPRADFKIASNYLNSPARKSFNSRWHS